MPKKSGRKIIVNDKRFAAMLGAAFLMATSSVGPGFLTQTAVFTEQLLSSFAFAVLISIILNAIIQVNIWQIIAVTRKKGQDIANAVFPGLGYVVSFFIVFGGLAFNIGNVAGGGLGLNALFGLNTTLGAVITAVICIMIFLSREAGIAMDRLVKILGALMIIVIAYVMFANNPPYLQAFKYSVFPKNMSFLAIVTIVGGTIGGYITFAGAHRLLDVGVCGKKQLGNVTRTSLLGIGLSSLIRILLFLAVLGVVSTGFKLDPANPPASVFVYAAGRIGLIFFGVVLWAAAVTSVIGAAYTSVTFLSIFHKSIDKYKNRWIIFFICFSTIIYIFIGRPVMLLIFAGAFNGLILPLALGAILLAAHNKRIVKDYRHPIYMTILGWLSFALTAFLAYETLTGSLFKLIKG
ncbi:MAG TPA: NRAMP family divalent metal transporter [Victivallales bacterium]|nr:NRAMP family divalent metal transporter [Victivallales bacterium]